MESVIGTAQFKRDPSAQFVPEHFPFARSFFSALLMVVMLWSVFELRLEGLYSVSFLRPSVVEVQTQAGKLIGKQQLMDDQGVTHPILVGQPVAGRFEVYNIEVSGLHTYFVGENRVLVHNKAMKAIKPGVFKGEHLLEELAEAEQDMVHRLIDHGQDVTLLPGKPPVVKVNNDLIPTEALEAYVRTLDEMGRGVLTGSLDGLTPAEKSFVEELLAQGKNVEIIPCGAGRTADFLIDGVRHELKSLSSVMDTSADGLSEAIARRAMDGRGQADRIIIDARNQQGMTKEIAERGAKRAYGADNKSGGKIQNIQIIGNDFTVDIPRVPGGI